MIREVSRSGTPRGTPWGSPQPHHLEGARSPNYHRQLSESYEDRTERRHQNRECLRARRNITTCRSHRKSWNAELEEKFQNLRQEEFLKRRHLSVEKDTHKSDSPSRFAKQLRGEATTTASGKISWIVSESPQRESIIKEISTRERGTQTYPSVKSCQHISQQTDCGITVLDKEIIQLSDYLKEALRRELHLKQKLAVLQQLLTTIIQASEKSWKAQLNEDTLKSKLTTLEAQLHACAQNYSKESVKKAMIQMEEQKFQYEQKAKESLQRVIEEKVTTEQKLQTTQRSLTITEQECTHWKESYEKMKTEWTKLTDSHTEMKNELLDLQSKLQLAETQKSQLQELQNRLDIMWNVREELQSKVDVLQEDHELKRGQLNAMKVKLRNAEEQKLSMETKVTYLEAKLRTTEEQKLNMEKRVTYLEDKLRNSEEQKLSMETKVTYLEAKLRNTEEQKLNMETRVTYLEASLREQSSQLQMKEETLLCRDVMNATLNQNLQLLHQKEETSVRNDVDQTEKKLREALQQTASQLKAREKECAELRSELEALGDEYCSCQRKLQQCREELNQFQRKRPQKSCGRWIPLLVLVIAIAAAVFYTNLERFIN